MSQNQCHVPLEDLQDMLDYNANTGAVHWTRSRKVHPRYRGKPINRINRDGYIQVQIDGRQYAMHRLVWYLAYGVKPRGHLNHRNGNKADNRLANLEEMNKRLEPLLSTVVFGETTETKPPWE